MCGRFDSHLPKMHGWADLLGEWPESVPQRHNVAPSTTIAAYAPFFKISAPGTTQAMPMRWGMVPNWAKDFDSKYATFNARLETVAEKPSFRHAWKHSQRCLIPMRGYYEWQSQTGQNTKQPFFITDKNVGGLVAAGLYEIWGEGDDSLYSCTMITRPADVGLDRIHARMPVLLQPESADTWLADKDKADAEFLRTVEAPDVVYWPVSKAVGNTRNDSPSLSEPLDVVDEEGAL